MEEGGQDDEEELIRTRQELRAAQQQLRSIQSESQRLDQHHRGLSKELATAHQQLRSTHEERLGAQKERQRFQDQLQATQEESDRFQKQLTIAEQRLHTTQEEIRSLHEERQGDQQQLRLARQEIQRLGSIQGGSTSHEEEELSEELARTRQCLQEAQERTQNIEALLKDEINRHAVESHKLKKELQDKDVQLAEAQEKSRQATHKKPMKILPFEYYSQHIQQQLRR
jgi:chromosome segregation ATPase